MTILIIHFYQLQDGTTSLHLAMWKNKSQVVARLIKAGANPNLQDQVSIKLKD